MSKIYLNPNAIKENTIPINKIVTVDLDGKQDIIDDLEDIRDGAAKGATALQSFAETDPIFSASPAASITNSDITNWNAKTSNTGTITGIKMNGVSKGTSGEIDLGDVITSLEGYATENYVTNAITNAKIEGGDGDPIDLSGYATKDDLNKKVDKVTGKGLSTNDFTDDLKTKLDGISIGAEVNVQSDWNATSGDALILNKPSLAAVATSGDYDDLLNTPSEITESTVSGWGFTKNTGTYSKPETGIPASDLSEDVQTALGKANSALQSHQSLDGKQDKLESGVNIKTINGESLLGDGDISIDSGLTNFMVNTTWQDLKNLRDSGKLIPGMQYRITDYVTTVGELWDFKSAGHQFDIIVTANDIDSLNEVARACLHEGDTYFSEAGAKLDAWKIWYCLDNDLAKHPWCDTVNGKGVIYRMIDEWGNDCSYDFKNLLFKEKLSFVDEDVCISDDGIETWVYTFVTYLYYADGTWSDMYDGTIKHGGGVILGIHNNIVKSLRNVFLNCKRLAEDGSISTFSYCYNNIVGVNSHATFGPGCTNNVLGNDCGFNRFGKNCEFNTLSNDCNSNSFGNNCRNNYFLNDCSDNVFGDSCSYNSFGNNCWNNIFGEICQNNSFGNNCDGNVFGRLCTGNSFGNECFENSFVDSNDNNICVDNSTFDNHVGKVVLRGSRVTNIHICTGCYDIEIEVQPTAHCVTTYAKSSNNVLQRYVVADIVSRLDALESTQTTIQEALNTEV